MDFILPEWGGAMVHSDPQLTDNINLPVPKNDVKILWRRNELKGEKAGTVGNGIAGNGKIAANTFNSVLKRGGRDNLVIYDYYGNRIWTSGKELNAVAATSTPMVSIHDEVIACDNEKILMVAPKDDDEYEIVWESEISPAPDGPRVLIPFSPTIVDGKTIILPTNGPVYVFDAQTGKSLAMKKLGSDETNGEGYFSTINSACVNGKRVYVTTEFSKHTNPPSGRLYAVDVNLDAENSSEILTEAWYYPFIGRSQASPLFIDDTIYFDGYTPGLGLSRKPYVYALTDKGECYKVLNVPYPHITLFSFSKDPRDPRGGGFWYEDTRGKKLVHFKKEDGSISIIEEIFIKDIVPSGLDIYKPLSCMTICDERDPVMLISAITYFFKKYVIAIELDKINSNDSDPVCWYVKIADFGINYAGGQFTILKKNKDPKDNRIVFGTYWDGVMAIGEADED